MTTINSSWMLLSAVLLIGCQGVRPANLGTRDGRLAPCPSSPNCVSSQAADDGHRIDPLPYTGTAADAMARLAAIVRSLPRAVIITEEQGYLYAEFTSAFFRFKDDGEFLADDAAKVIHVRSASRLGHSDLGVNRKRIEMIRDQWEKGSPSP
jgi:uncharacterized protein (DUF1499 family)